MFRYLALLTTLLSGAAAAATPPQGVELTVRRGFFTEVDIGTFFTLGGDDGYSNAQSYLQLGIGVDLSQHFELGAHFGLGANAFNCFAGRQAGACAESESFTVSFFDLTLAYLIPLRERLYLTPKIAAGWTLLDPAPRRAEDGRPITRGANFGAGLGVEFATAMDHLSIGGDVIVRYVPVAHVPAVTIFPRVKYTF